MSPDFQYLLIHSSPDGIIAFDSELNILAWNPRMEKIFSLTASEIVGKKISDSRMPELLSSRNASFFYEAIQGKSATISTIHFENNAQFNFFEISYYPMLHPDGSIAGGIAMLKEIKLKSRVNQLSSRTYIQFQDVLESMTDAFVSLDANWRYTYVNKKAAAAFSRTQEYLIGKHIWTEFPEGIGQPFYKAYYQAVKEKINITLEEYYAPYDRWFENRIYPLTDGIAIFFSDVTERKKEEEKLKQLNLKLEEQNKELIAQEEELNSQQEELRRSIKELSERNFELDQIIYKTSHDLRAPLVSILGLISVIKMETDFEQVKKYLEFVENRITKLDEFVKSMLNFSKINRTQLKPEPIDFNEIINQCFQNMKYISTFDKVGKEVSIAGEPFSSDALRLEIIFNNLISNAIKYMNIYASQPFLNINIKIENEMADIHISDNGIGIKEEFLTKVFEMFVRGTEKSDGSGLGLYIVKQTVDRLNGKISIHSIEGEGTQIHILIPSSI